MSFSVLGLALLTFQARPPAPPPAAPDAAEAAHYAVANLCAADRAETEEAPSHGFVPGVEAHGRIARVAGGWIAVRPASASDRRCRIRGELTYGESRSAANRLLGWADELRLPWTVRDRNGPLDAWEGPWFYGYSRGDLHIRIEYQRPQTSPRDPAADSPSRLYVEWTPPR